MPAEWTEVESLIRALGGVRAASFLVSGATQAARAAIDQAIREATEAVADTLNAPTADPAALGRAREAIEVAADVLVNLDAQLVASRQLRERSTELRARARELLEQARPGGRRAG
jgi:hypothetical protein